MEPERAPAPSQSHVSETVASRSSVKRALEAPVEMEREVIDLTGSENCWCGGCGSREAGEPIGNVGSLADQLDEAFCRIADLEDLTGTLRRKLRRYEREMSQLRDELDFLVQNQPQQ